MRIGCLPLQKADCLACSACFVLLDDNKLLSDITCDRQYLLTQKHVTVVRAVDFHPEINKCQVLFHPDLDTPLSF